ncbi:MAG: hypothetical protein JWN98_2464 [Abditibacteriota bacterium]|nr:hypothetical protein [Abditibacteriota bacterium]
MVQRTLAQQSESRNLDAASDTRLSGTAEIQEEAVSAPAQDGPRYRQSGFWPRQRLRLTLLGFIALLVASVWWRDVVWMSHTFWPGALVTLCGVALRVWAAGTLCKHEALAMHGPYAFMRHPLYAGTGLVAIGQGLMSGIPFAGIWFPMLWLALYRPAMREEEGFLTSIYGDQYRDYARRVPALVPRLWGHKSALPGDFSWSQAWRNREYEGILVNVCAALIYGCLSALR